MSSVNGVDIAGAGAIINSVIVSTGGVGISHSGSGTGDFFLSNTSATGSTAGVSIDAASGLSLQGAGNTVVGSGTGSAITLRDVTINAAGLAFASITSGVATGTAVTFDNVDGTGTLDGGALVIGGTTGGGTEGLFIQDSSANFDFSSATIDNVADNGVLLEDNFGTVNFDTVDIDGSGNFAIQTIRMNNTFSVLGGSIGATTTNGGGVRFNNRAATINFAADITNGGPGRSVLIDNRTGGVINISGNINDTGAGIDIDNNSAAATINFSGSSKVLSTGTSNAIEIFGASGPTVNFTNGGLDIDTTTGRGINTSVGTLTIQGSGNSINVAGAGQAVNLENTTIGAAGVTLQSISQTGGSSAIVLVNTGSTGFFSVTGDAGSTINGSGGAIANTTGEAIRLQDASNISFDQLNLNNIGENGVEGVRVNGLSYSNATLNSVGGTNATDDVFSFNRDGQGDNGVIGTVLLSNLDINNFHSRGVDIVNEGTGSLDLDIVDVDFDTNSTTVGVGLAAVNIQTEGAVNTDLLISGGTFTDILGEALFYSAQGTGVNTLEVTGVTATNNTDPNAEGGIVISGENGSTITFDINSSTISAQREALRVIGAAGVGQTTTLNGVVGGPLGADGNVFSSDISDAVDLEFGNSAVRTAGGSVGGTISLQNNIFNFDDDGLGFDHRDVGGVMNVTIANNTFNGVAGDDGVATDVDDGIFIFTDDDIGAPMADLGVVITNNTFNNIQAGDNVIEVADVQDGNQLCVNISGNAIGVGGGDIELDTTASADLTVVQTSAANLSAVNNGITVDNQAPGATFGVPSCF